jgi:hypothetical protein
MQDIILQLPPSIRFNHLAYLLYARLQPQPRLTVCWIRKIDIHHMEIDKPATAFIGNVMITSGLRQLPSTSLSLTSFQRQHQLTFNQIRKLVVSIHRRQESSCGRKTATTSASISPLSIRSPDGDQLGLLRKERHS